MAAPKLKVIRGGKSLGQVSKTPQPSQPAKPAADAASKLTRWQREIVPAAQGLEADRDDSAKVIPILQGWMRLLERKAASNDV